MYSVEQMCSSEAMANDIPPNELRLLTKTCRLCYERGYTQQSLAAYLRSFKIC
jgi:hypothetical protein